MDLVAIDPGTTRSAMVQWNGTAVVGKEMLANQELLELLLGKDGGLDGERLVIERFESFGMPVGAEVFDTAMWIGRFWQAWDPRPCTLITRRQVKLHLCHSMKAKDANIRQALLDKVGPQGTKKAPGPTYGLSGDLWSALAIAITYQELHDL